MSSTSAELRHEWQQERYTPAARRERATQIQSNERNPYRSIKFYPDAQKFCVQFGDIGHRSVTGLRPGETLAGFVFDTLPEAMAGRDALLSQKQSEAVNE